MEFLRVPRRLVGILLVTGEIGIGWFGDEVAAAGET
jgi:hypothetical protein